MAPTLTRRWARPCTGGSPNPPRVLTEEVRTLPHTLSQAGQLALPDTAHWSAAPQLPCTPRLSRGPAGSGCFLGCSGLAGQANTREAQAAHHRDRAQQEARPHSLRGRVLDPRLRGQGQRVLQRPSPGGDSPRVTLEKVDLCMPVCLPSSVLATPGCSALTVTPVPGEDQPQH